MQVCTIIAKNYLAHARVLARSLAEHNPGSRLWTLIIDEFDGYIDPAAEPFEVLTPDDVGCDAFPFMALRYTVLELSTAVKPWLLRHLMEQTGGPVTYLDPDIEVYGSLQRLDDLAAERGVVVIPHNNVPLPPDGLKPSQIDIMIAGIYNLGYVSLAPRPEVDDLLDWWADRLRRDCRVDPAWGYFVDQRWFDLVPGFLTNFAIVREPEYNVAYWNLHSRRLELDGERYLVDGRPLAFFHFSGFDPERPLLLSLHQNRIDVSAEPALERLLAAYAADVMAHGHAVSRRWPYSYTVLGDGTEIDELVRSLSTQFEEEVGREAAAARSLFTPAGAREFQAWLAADAPDAPGINRVLARIYEDRRDLQRAYPDLRGADAKGLIHWADEFGSAEIPLLARVMARRNGAAAAPEGHSTASPAPQSGVPLPYGNWGINLVGDFVTPSESSEVARQLVTVLDAGTIPAVPVRDLSQPFGAQREPFPTVSPEEAPFLVNLICASHGGALELAAAAGHRFFSGRYSIALWLGDLLPTAESVELLQEIWVPSQYVASILAGQADVPVMVVPLPVEPPAFAPRSRRDLGLPEDRWLFMASIEHARQNPRGLMAAFQRAFGAEEPVSLALIGPSSDSEVRAQELRSAVAEHPGIQLVEGPATRAERLAMIAQCDCYVSLHHREPLGLAMAEAMWLARPVIATGHSGNLDFMNDANSLIVRHEMRDGIAEPDLEHAATLMRQVLEDPAAARALGERAAVAVRQTNSPAVAAATIGRRLDAIRSTGRVPRWLRGRPTGPAALARAHHMVTVGPPAAPRLGPGFRIRRAARNALLRALRPYTSYRHQVDLAMLEALEGLEPQAGQERDHAPLPERAQLLAELRGSRQLRAALDVQARAVEELRRIITLQNDRGLYLALSELAARHARIGEAPGEAPAVVGLSGFELCGYSQNGEDGVLAEILRRIGVESRYFVEFGVEAGVEGNCVLLADVARWRGLFMEADAQRYRLLERKYAPHAGVATRQAEVTAENIEALLAAAEVPLAFDVLSIDVDGQDYWIWEALEHYRPRVVVVEYNSALDPHRRLVQPRDAPGWDGSDYFGASLGAIRGLGERKGYRLVHTETAGANAFLVSEELAEGRFPEGDEAALRRVPNYFQSAYRHPPDEKGRRYLDLDSREMVPSTR